MTKHRTRWVLVRKRGGFFCQMQAFVDQRPFTYSWDQAMHDYKVIERGHWEAVGTPEGPFQSSQEAQNHMIARGRQ